MLYMGYYPYFVKEKRHSCFAQKQLLNNKENCCGKNKRKKYYKCTDNLNWTTNQVGTKLSILFLCCNNTFSQSPLPR